MAVVAMSASLEALIPFALWSEGPLGIIVCFLPQTVTEQEGPSNYSALYLEDGLSLAELSVSFPHRIPQKSHFF